LGRDVVSTAILEQLARSTISPRLTNPEEDLAVAVPISAEAYARLLDAWDAVSDEHRAQLLLKALST
jgi:hypothetical protein